MVACEEILQQLPAYMLRELGDKQSVLVHEHLRACEGCRKDAGQFEKMQKLLRDQQHAIGGGGAVLSEQRMKRIRFTAMHPVFDWIYYRHRMVSGACAVLLLLIVLFLLRNVALFREPVLEESIPVWHMFRTGPPPERLKEPAGIAGEDP